MQKSMRLLLCASTTALILGAAPIGAFIAPAQAQVAVAISATIAPPLLPVYAQPPIPGPGYLWIPGYWAWNAQEYYWVPGYWSMPPTVGFYWTPPYWGWLNGAYVFNAGYWGPTVGFYGGINYGFGYNGVGYQGGMWQGNTFVYNRTVNNFGNVRIANTYSRPVSNPANHVAFNGGNGGTTARPTQAEMAARAKGAPPTAAQMQHQEAAGKIPRSASTPITATRRSRRCSAPTSSTAQRGRRMLPQSVRKPRLPSDRKRQLPPSPRVRRPLRMLPPRPSIMPITRPPRDSIMPITRRSRASTSLTMRPRPARMLRITRRSCARTSLFTRRSCAPTSLLARRPCMCPPCTPRPARM